jgi:hypothetical protein
VQTAAERLAAELDREQESTASRFTEYQQKMKQRIQEATRELEETKQRIQEVAVAPLTDDLEDIEDDDQENDLDGHLSPCSSMGDMADHDDHDPQCQSHVEVSLLESHLNIGMEYAGKGVNGGETLEYCVSEPPSDDENEDGEEGKGEGKYDQLDVIEIQSFN